jgi:hypothetical protein
MLRVQGSNLHWKTVGSFRVCAVCTWTMTTAAYKLTNLRYPGWRQVIWHGLAVVEDRMSSNFCITAPHCTVTLSTLVACCIIDAFGSVDLSCIGNFTRFECTVLAAEGRSVLVFIVESAEHYTLSKFQTFLAFRWIFLFPSELNCTIFPPVSKDYK